MELYKQEQRNFPPDVFPTPSAIDEVVVDDSNIKSENNSFSSPVDEEINEEVESAKNSNINANSANTEFHKLNYVSRLNSTAITTICPFCKQRIITIVRYRVSIKQYIYFFLLCTFYCWPCSFVPYLFHEMYDVDHYCSSCGKYLDTYYSE